MGVGTRWGTGWCCVGYALFALGSMGCSTPDAKTEQALGTVEKQALTVTIDGHEWSTSDMGTSGHYPCGDPGEGDWEYSDGIFAVSNAKGRGLANPHWGDPAGCEKDGLYDSASFLSTPITGDFELTVRVTSITGMKNAEVGVMLRENIGTDGTGPTAAVEIKHNSNGDHCTSTAGELDQLAYMSRALVGEEPNQGYVVIQEGGSTRTKPPTGSEPGGVWLSLQRLGNDFAVAHARDDNGRPGTWVSNGGGEFKPSQAYVGLFAAVSVFLVPGDSLATTSATFDHLSIRQGGVRYRTGSLGASMLRGEDRFPLATVSTGYISTGMNGFYVAPNGMSYKYAQTNDPGGFEIQPIDAQGNLIRIPNLVGNFGFLEGGIAGGCDEQTPANCSLYVAQQFSASEARIRRFTPLLDEELDHLEFPTAADRPARIRGLSARGSKVFVSDYGRPAACPDVPPNTTDSDPDERQNCVVNDAGCDTTTCASEGTTCTPVSCEDSQYVRVVDLNPASPDESCKFALERPGASAVDNEGNVWVVQMATPYPDIVKPDLGAYLLKYSPAIVCVKPDCTACGRSITTGLHNPTAVAIDADNRLFVAENGPAQNIRIYDHLDTVPVLAGTVGEDGGAFGGPHPGLLVDPDHGGDHRFYALLGLGLDSGGNLYVASNAPRTAIQKFSKTGTLAWGAADWSLFGLGREIGAFDIDANGNTDYYTLMRRLTLDPDSSSPDFNWTQKSIIRPPYDVTGPGVSAVAAPIHHFSQGGAMRLRRIGNKRFLFELNDNLVRIFRFVGELIQPCGHIKLVGTNTRELWFDADEHGDIDTGELSTETGGAFYPEAAEDGSLWLSSWDLWELVVKQQQSTNGEVPLYEIRRKTLYSDLLTGLTAAVPRYRSDGDTLYIQGSVGSEPNPALDDCPTSDTECTDDCEQNENECCSEPGSCDHTCNSFASCCLWDPGPNAAPSADRAPNKCRRECSDCGARSCPDSWGRPVVLRFDGWRATPVNTIPTKTYQVNLPTQLDTSQQADDFQMRFMDPLCGCSDWGYTSFDVAGDMFFVEERHGAIHVHGAATGSEVDRLFPGPEASGLMGWSDIPGSMQAFKRPNSSEYLITTIDSFDRGRNLTFSWKQLELGEECWDRHQCESGICTDGRCASAECSDGWTPSTLAPVAWYVAADDKVTTSNGKVSVWSDQSGNGLDVTNDNIYGQPTYSSTGWNGTNPTLSFNGGALLRRASFPGPGAGTEHPFSVLGVVRSAIDQNGSIAAWWADSGGSMAAVRCSVVTSGGNSFFNLARDDDNWVQQSYTTNADIGTDEHVVAWRFSPGTNAPGTMQITVDDTTYTQPMTTSLASLPLDMLIVGARTNLPTWLFHGDISELVIVDSAISDTDVMNFGCYARQKWDGLP